MSKASIPIPMYGKDSLPVDFDAPGGNAWAEFRKTATTRAIKINGPFRVLTSESENEPFYCEDGWLAIDSRGYPYAIADDEFRQIYEPVTGAELRDNPHLPESTVDKVMADLVSGAGWKGTEPARGTRRALIRDTFMAQYGFGPEASLNMADAIESALLLATPPETSGTPIATARQIVDVHSMLDQVSIPRTMDGGILRPLPSRVRDLVHRYLRATEERDRADAEDKEDGAPERPLCDFDLVDAARAELMARIESREIVSDDLVFLVWRLGR